MKKFFKAILAVLGGAYAVFSFFIPIAFALVLIQLWDLSPLGQWTILIMGLLSSLYKAISIGFMN